MPQRLLLLLIFLATGLAAQQSTNEQVLARAELGRKTIELGDQIWLTVNISAPPGTDVTGMAPDYIDGLEGLETIDAKELNVVAENPELLLQQRFLITSFDTGYIAVPPLPFVFKAADGRLDTAYTNDLLLTVNALPVGDDEEIMPIKPIIEEPLNLLDFWWLFLLLIVAGLGYILYTIQKRRKADAPPPPPPPPAYLVALDALKELEGKELWQQSQTKEYYSELTHILREYLEGRFNVQALEMTTRQITDKLSKRNDFDKGRAKELSNLLQISDLVKFAKARPAVELHAESLDRVRAFVKETGIEPEPAPEPEPNMVAVVAPATSPAPAAAPDDSNNSDTSNVSPLPGKGTGGEGNNEEE
ncbi:hypothetical protein FUA23_17520 [Neolewinella aurantiaca]|uniref:Cell wall anchor protein n=1 Tax=Neolewinella aurantiaca TaxID=2602767 RepID=A0A5C7FK59_9BACT|nr:hypothetical protein [Neolewinella aurantiaca]TXF87733.1 hypothetical protein FUA23_17520 [Neolewinella aurantiaca]